MKEATGRPSTAMPLPNAPRRSVSPVSPLLVSSALRLPGFPVPRLSASSCVLTLLLVLLGVFASPPVAAQQALIDALRAERLRVRAAEILAARGLGALPLPPVAVPSRDPLLQQVAARSAAEAAALAAREAQARADSVREAQARPPVLERIRWGKIEPDAQGPFLATNLEVYWTTEGTRAFAPIDTMATWFLRGRLAFLFGSPTRNAAAMEQEQYAMDDRSVQFEYWFMVNDSIPVLVMDVTGPTGQGLLIAGARERVDLMPQLKRDLAERLSQPVRLAPYVDYYYRPEERRWYRTGYDGTAFFELPARRTPTWARTLDSRAVKWRIHR